MRQVPLRRLVDEQSMPPMLDWRDVITQVIRRPLDSQRGADIEEIRRGIRILDALDRADDVLELEDRDWEHLKDKTLAMQWAFVDRRVLAYVDDVTGATEQVPLVFNGVAG